MHAVKWQNAAVSEFAEIWVHDAHLRMTTNACGRDKGGLRTSVQHLLRFRLDVDAQPHGRACSAPLLTAVYSQIWLAKVLQAPQPQPDQHGLIYCSAGRHVCRRFDVTWLFKPCWPGADLLSVTPFSPMPCSPTLLCCCLWLSLRSCRAESCRQLHRNKLV